VAAKVQGKPLELKVFVNTILAETWEEPGEVIEAHTLLARLETTRRIISPRACACSPPADVQDNRIELRVWGWGAARSRGGSGKEVIVGDTDSDDVWQELDRVVARDLRQRRRRGDEGAAALRRRRLPVQPRVSVVPAAPPYGAYACRGVGGEGVPFLGKATIVRATRGVSLYPVGVDAAKRRSCARASTPRSPDPRLPEGAPRATCTSRTSGATSRSSSSSPRRSSSRAWSAAAIVREWVKIRERNEELDCQNYAHAALHALGVPTLLQLGIIAGATPKAAPKPDDDEEPPDDAPPRGVQPPRPPKLPAPTRPPARSRGGWIRNGLRR
jgi:phage terminase large subunit GpA-like protein